jgi:hypothetical protein
MASRVPAAHEHRFVAGHALAYGTASGLEEWDLKPAQLLALNAWLRGRGTWRESLESPSEAPWLLAVNLLSTGSRSHSLTVVPAPGGLYALVLREDRGSQTRTPMSHYQSQGLSDEDCGALKLIVAYGGANER